MILDLIIIILLIVSFIIGLARGALRQLFHLGALALAIIAAFFGSRSLEKVILNLTGWPAIITWNLSWVSILLVVYLIFISISRKISSRVQPIGGWNRTLGGVIGFLKGSFIAILLVFVLGSLPPQLIAKLPAIKGMLDDSVVAQATAPYNLLANLGFVKGLSNLYRIQNNPFLREKLINEESYQKLIAHKKVREIMEDEELEEAFQYRKYSVLMANDKIFNLLRDREVRALLIDLVLEKAHANSTR